MEGQINCLLIKLRASHTYSTPKGMDFEWGIGGVLKGRGWLLAGFATKFSIDRGGGAGGSEVNVKYR